MEFTDLIEGRLLRRYKRFLADVELSAGEVITVHCPNTGAMTGCAQPGSRVWLSRSEVKTRKYPHTWELVATEEGVACIHSAKANTVVREAFVSGSIPGFKDYPEISTEVKYAEGSRADLLLGGERGQVFVEVKSVTLCRGGGVGVFPDAVSERARKHLYALQSVVDRNTRALLMFCVFHQGISHVSAAGDIDPKYRAAMQEVMARGVEVQAWATRISTAGVQLSHSLPFTLDPPLPLTPGGGGMSVAGLSAQQLTGVDESHLVGLPCGQRMQQDAADAFVLLQADARAAGFDLAIASSFRSYQRQLAIWNAKVTGERPVHDDAGQCIDIGTLSATGQLHAILRFSAIPGSSRHHWGTDVDVFDAAAMAQDYQLQLSPQEVAAGGVFDALHCWLDERMEANQSHGFYRPYNNDRGGVAAERWHLSYAPCAMACAGLLTPLLLRQCWDGQGELLLRDEIEHQLADILQRYVQVPAGWCPSQ